MGMGAAKRRKAAGMGVADWRGGSAGAGGASTPGAQQQWPMCVYSKANVKK